MAGRNVYPVMRLAVTGTAETNRKLAMLSDAIRRRITRYAVAAAARPILAEAKGVARSVAESSRRREGIGTMSRAMALKVATSKSNPDVSYAIIGADRNYSEFVNLLMLPGRARVHSIDIARKGKKIKFGATNIGRIARRARLDPKSNSTRRRVPKNYARLLEYGTRRSRAFPIIGSASRGAQYIATAAFRTTLANGISREVAKLAGSSKRAA